MAKKANKKFRFKAGVSFAKEDRKDAEKLVEELKAQGTSVFYDKDYVAEIWGEGGLKFEEIYGEQCEYVIPLVSQNYLNSDYARHEFQAARKAEKKRGKTVILPVRLDGSSLVGLTEDRPYLAIDEYSIEQIAAMFAERCGSAQSEDKSSSKPPRAESLLDSKTRKAFEILASSRMLLTTDHFEALFPEVNWKKAYTTLRQKGYLKLEGRLVHVDKKQQRIVLQHDSDQEAFRKLWLEKLEPLRHYMDMALCLSLMYLEVGDIKQSAQVLADVANGTNVGHWNGAYILSLESLASSKLSRRLGADLRIQVLHALGKCLSHASRFGEAKQWLNKAIQTAKRKKDAVWLGQISLTIGVAHFHDGDRKQAVRWYEKARDHADKTGDHLLAGRALGNLAELKREESPFQAKELLKESINRKKAAGDSLGEVIGIFQLGNIEATNGAPEKAIPIYEKALAKRNAFEEGDDEALLLNNLGLAHSECGRNAKAASFFKKSASLANELGYEETERLALRGQAMASFNLKRFQVVVDVSNRLIELNKEHFDLGDELTALHGRGVSMILLGDIASGRKSIQSALRLARRNEEIDWVTRCIADLSRKVTDGSFGVPDLVKLRNSARREARNDNIVIAATIWLDIAHVRSETGFKKSDVDDAFEEALDLVSKLKGSDDELVSQLEQLQKWLWVKRRYDESIQMLERIETVCDSFEALNCRNHRATLLLDLGRMDEAERLLFGITEALEEDETPEMLQIVLCNYAECLRRIGRLPESEQVFERAIAIAIQIQDARHEIFARHNQALAVQHSGDYEKAKELFIKCRDRAQRRKLWGEYVRAWEALATLAFDVGDIKLALSRYERAMKEAKKHGKSDSLIRSALNYARCKLWQGKPKKGLIALSKCESEFRDEPDAHLYYFTLGELCEETQELERAALYFETAKKIAGKFGDQQYASNCSSHIAGILEHQGRLSGSIAEINKALKLEVSVEQKLLLLNQRLETELQRDNEKAAQATYDEAKLIESTIDDIDVSDIDLTLANHSWKGDYDDRLQAMKIWTNTFGQVIGIEFDSGDFDDDDELKGGGESLYSVVIGPIISYASRPPNNPTLEEFDKLLFETREWLASEMGSPKSKQTGRCVDLILSPFDMVKAILPVANSPRGVIRAIDTHLESLE